MNCNFINDYKNNLNVKKFDFEASPKKKKFSGFHSIIGSAYESYDKRFPGHLPKGDNIYLFFYGSI